MSYNEFQHRHNFAVWAGARAAQRGFTSVENLKNALEQSGVCEFSSSLPKSASPKEYDALHRVWCSNICDYLNKKEIQNVTYGRAAKLIAVYLKSMIVLPDLNSVWATLIHPPIDRILLKGLAKSNCVNKEQKHFLNTINWTQLNVEQYFELLKLLYKINSPNPLCPTPLWKIERFWKVTNK